jgi:hypothetical protein
VLSLWFRDVTERAISTYVQAFLGALLAAPMLDLSAAKAAAFAAIPAALAVLKGAVARFVGDSDNASLDAGLGTLPLAKAEEVDFYFDDEESGCAGACETCD